MSSDKSNFSKENVLALEECLKEENWLFGTNEDSVCVEGDGEPPIQNVDFLSLSRYIQCKQPQFMKVEDRIQKNSSATIIPQIFLVFILAYLAS